MMKSPVSTLLIASSMFIPSTPLPGHSGLPCEFSRASFYNPAATLLLTLGRTNGRV
jgi:hypothetical protein